MSSSDYDDSGIDAVEGPEIEAESGSRLAAFANVSDEDVKGALQAHIGEEQSAGREDRGLDDSETKPAPTGLSQQEMNQGWEAFQRSFPDAESVKEEMALHIEASPGKYGAPKDQGELVSTLEDIYAAASAGTDYEQLSEAAKQNYADDLVHQVYEGTKPWGDALTELVHRLGPDDPRVQEAVEELQDDPEAHQALIVQRQIEAFDRSATAITSFIEGKSEAAKAYREDPAIRELAESLVAESGVDPVAFQDAETAKGIYESAVKAAIEIRRTERLGAWKSELAETMFRTDERGEAEAKELAYQRGPISRVSSTRKRPQSKT